MSIWGVTDWRRQVERFQVEVEWTISPLFVNIQLLVKLKWNVYNGPSIRSHLLIRKRSCEQELARTVHEVSDDLHHVTYAEMHGGVSAEDQVIGDVDGISDNVVNLKLPVSVPELLPVVVDVGLHDVIASVLHIRS